MFGELMSCAPAVFWLPFDFQLPLANATIRWMSSNRLRRYGVLEDAERGVRPETVRRLTFEEVSAPGPAFRDTSGIVPIESVRDGDVQVLAARSPRSLPEQL